MPDHRKIDQVTQKRIEKAQRQAYGPISIDGPTVAERIWLSASREIGANGITREQVGAVMHALADYSLNQRMVSDCIADLYITPLAYGEPNPPELAAGLGRWFHAIGDRIAHPEIYDK